MVSSLVAIICSIVDPFVITRGMAFGVHGTSGLTFTGASARLLRDENLMVGVFLWFDSLHNSGRRTESKGA